VAVSAKVGRSDSNFTIGVTVAVAVCVGVGVSGSILQPLTNTAKSRTAAQDPQWARRNFRRGCRPTRWCRVILTLREDPIGDIAEPDGEVWSARGSDDHAKSSGHYLRVIDFRQQIPVGIKSHGCSFYLDA
jgi:hypothetical protein